MKNLIKANEINKSGVYCIKSKINNKKYIGSAVNLSSRYRSHLSYLMNNKHRNKHLQNHFNKHGNNCFVFYVIELCETNELIKREQYHIDKTKNKFNIRIIADSNLGVKWSKETKMKNSGWHHTNETKEKIRQFHLGNKYRLGYKASDETKIKNSNASKGRKHTDASKKLISEKLTGRKISDEHKIKLSKLKKGNTNWKNNKLHTRETYNKISESKTIYNIEQYDKQGNFLKLYKNSNVAAKAVNGSSGNIHSVCIGHRKTHKNFIWKRIKKSQNR